MKKVYKNLDYIRILSCILVLLYHLNILKGGYLLVCTFFVLSGYLAIISAFSKDFSIKEYYKNKFFKLYLPLLIVTFITIAISRLFINDPWLNLKPETTSIILGYNNFWQLSANLDYFARHINSPFMHLWYMGIILQFELVFPLIYFLFKKVSSKFKKIGSIILSSFITIIFLVLFIYSSINNGIMTTYYSSLTRIFSIFFGITLGLVHYFYKPMVIFEKKNIKNSIFYFYMLVLIILSIFMKTNYYVLGMIITTLISCRLIDYGVSLYNKNDCCNKAVKTLSGISYEVYLVQYPIIYFFQDVSMNYYLKLLLIIALTFIIAFLLKQLFSNKTTKWLRYPLLVIFVGCSLYGGYQYVIAVDHTNEMRELEQELLNNAQNAQKNQEDYAQKLKQEEASYMENLKLLESSASNLETFVKNLPMTCVGDSVMLGAYDNIHNMFKNSYIDAKVSRTAWEIAPILKNLKNKKMLGDVLVINLGANGDCDDNCKNNIMQIIDGRETFWFNTTNYNYVNNNLTRLAKRYPNLHIIDWKSITRNHKEYFVADGIHLTGVGREIYVKTLYDAIYNRYLEKYQTNKDNLIKEYQNKLKNKVTFYGNDLLLNNFANMQESFTNDNFVILNDNKYDSLKEKIENTNLTDTTTNKIVLLLDSSFSINSSQLNTLGKLVPNSILYFVNIQDKTYDVSVDNIKIIDFYQEIANNPDYLFIDKIHLTESGNSSLTKFISEYID